MPFHCPELTNFWTNWSISIFLETFHLMYKWQLCHIWQSIIKLHFYRPSWNLISGQVWLSGLWSIVCYSFNSLTKGQTFVKLFFSIFRSLVRQCTRVRQIRGRDSNCYILPDWPSNNKGGRCEAEFIAWQLWAGRHSAAGLFTTRFLAFVGWKPFQTIGAIAELRDIT